MIDTGVLIFGVGFYLSQAYLDLPPTAIRVGLDSAGGDLYLGVAQGPAEFTPAFISNAKDFLNFSSEGAAYSTNILTYVTLEPSCNISWVDGSGGNLPANAVAIGGNDTDKYYVGRLGLPDLSVRVGKIIPKTGLLYYSNGITEATSTTYEVLSITNCVTTLGTSLYLSQSTHDTPSNAILAGENVDQSKVFVGVARHSYKLLPAGIIPASNSIIYSDDNKAITEDWQKIFLTLVEGYETSWVSDSLGNVPDNAVQLGGYNGLPYYVGRVQDALGENVVGKVYAGERFLTYPSKGDEQLSTQYEILTIKKLNKKTPVPEK